MKKAEIVADVPTLRLVELGPLRSVKRHVISAGAMAFVIAAVVFGDFRHSSEICLREGNGSTIREPRTGSGGAGSGPGAGCWSLLVRRKIAAPLGPAAAIIFLHKRRTPAGLRKLVVVDGRMRLPWRTPGRWTVSSIGLLASVRSPADTGSPRTAWEGEARRLDAEPFVAMYRLRLYAGQPDTIDPTHFTIHYELNGRPGNIDGWLLDASAPEVSQPAGAPREEPPEVRLAVRDGQARLTREQLWSDDSWISCFPSGYRMV